MNRALAFAMVLVGCGTNNNNGDGGTNQDLTVGNNADLTMQQGGGDMAGNGMMCQPDPMMDGQSCANGCPVGSGTIPVQDQTGACHCWYTCTPNLANSCPCGRFCATLYTITDGGMMPNGMGACLHGNLPGERCGAVNGMPIYGYGDCEDGTLCVNEGMSNFAYCSYKCAKQADCPAGTTCLQLQKGGNACVLNSSETGAAIGMMCMPSDLCALHSLCSGGVCTAQCNGAKDTTTCMGKTCTAVVDMSNMKTAGYVCK